MTGINMTLPPPSVTGTAIPGSLEINNSPTANYERLIATRRQAQDELAIENKKYAHKDRHTTPGGIKILAGIIAIAGAAFGLKKLLKK